MVEDEYTQWLKTPPGPRPPDAYALLGLDAACDDDQLIEAAAQTQLQRLEQFARRPQADIRRICQRLKAEVEQARILLATASLRAAYRNDLLSRHLESLAESPAAMPAPPKTPRKAPPPTRQPGNFPGQPPPPKLKTRLYLIIAAAVVVAALVVWILASQSSTTPPANQPTAQATPAWQPPRPPQGVPAPAPIAQNPNAGGSTMFPELNGPAGQSNPPPPAPAPAEGEQVASSGSKVFSDLNRRGGLDNLPPPSQIPTPSPAPPPPTPAPTPAPPPPPTSAPVAPRLPQPDSASQDRAEALIKDTYRQEFADSSTAGRLALAQMLLKVAVKTKDDSLARFVLLRDSRNLAVGAGDCQTAIRAVDEMAVTFDIDAWTGKLEAMKQANDAGAPAELVVAQCFTLADQAVTDDQGDAATRLVALAIDAAKRSSDPACLIGAQAAAERMRRLQRETPLFQTAMAILKTKPDDPEANLTAGKFLCFVRGDWTQGLQFLAKGSDARLQAVAAGDLKNPQRPTDQAALADDWWERAAADPTNQMTLKQRAAIWYRKALPQLTGFKKMLATQRIGEVDRSQQHAQLDGSAHAAAPAAGS